MRRWWWRTVSINRQHRFSLPQLMSSFRCEWMRKYTHKYIWNGCIIATSSCSNGQFCVRFSMLSWKSLIDWPFLWFNHPLCGRMREHKWRCPIEFCLNVFHRINSGETNSFLFDDEKWIILKMKWHFCRRLIADSSEYFAFENWFDQKKNDAISAESKIDFFNWCGNFDTRGATDWAQ